MKKQIIITFILLMAAACVTVFYFKNLIPPGTRTSMVMQTIPGDASLVFEFNNDKSFYDIFTGNKLFTAIIGKQETGELDTLRSQVLLNPSLEKYFTGQNIFISLHPSKTNRIDLLFTMATTKGFDANVLDELSKKPAPGLLVTPIRASGKIGYNIYISAIKKRFYVINSADNIFSGSFSKDLIMQASIYESQKNKRSFVLLSEQQNANSLANLYVNYSQLSPLFDQLFKTKNTDLFKSIRLLPGLAALSLNYKTDAIMFNGLTSVQTKEAASYLNLFTGQQPVENQLKDIFPSTTAYGTNFSVSDPSKFSADLSGWYAKAGLKNERDQLFNKINAETGTRFRTEFDNLLGNEFAVVTTRYMEKYALISVKDGSKLKLLLASISKLNDENTGQFIYDKLPFFLLGDAFNIFRQPYFLIIDNYLILANSSTEIASYNDSYLNRKFLSKNDQYNQFDNLLAARSNIAFLLNFKNAEPILKRELDPEIFDAFRSNEPGWSSFYAASWQLSSADKNFYTNFCIRLNTDTITAKN